MRPLVSKMGLGARLEAVAEKAVGNGVTFNTGKIYRARREHVFVTTYVKRARRKLSKRLLECAKKIYGLNTFLVSCQI
jgi:hypothetical protein